MAAVDNPRASRRFDGPPVAVCPDCGEPFWDSSVTVCPHDGSRVRPAAEAGPSTHVDRVVGGRYRLLGKIGEGGMGAVYIAEHALSLRRVAMKIIRPELESSKLARERFLRECQMLERLKSPHVVEVLESGESAAGEIFLVMELLEGETLGERLDRQGALSVSEVATIGGQVASALATAHAEGIVHRDMKPDNIFLCKDGSVRVLDFGIARLLDGQTIDGSQRKLTATGTIVGTPAYISPEQAAGRAVDPAADNYSFGVVLFEMLTGRTPFWGENAILLMGMHLKDPPPSLRDARPDLAYPDELVDLVDQLLAKKPTDRPKGEEVRRVLGELGSGIYTLPRAGGATPLELAPTAVGAPPIGPPSGEGVTQTVETSPRKLGWVLAAGLAAVVMLGALGAGAWWLGQSGDDGAVEGSASAPHATPVQPSSGDVAPEERPPADDPGPEATVAVGVDEPEPTNVEAAVEAPPENVEPTVEATAPTEPPTEPDEAQGRRRGARRAARHGAALAPTVRSLSNRGAGRTSTGNTTQTTPGRGASGRSGLVRDYY